MLIKAAVMSDLPTSLPYYQVLSQIWLKPWNTASAVSSSSTTTHAQHAQPITGISHKYRQLRLLIRLVIAPCWAISFWAEINYNCKLNLHFYGHDWTYEFLRAFHILCRCNASRGERKVWLDIAACNATTLCVDFCYSRKLYLYLDHRSLNPIHALLTTALSLSAGAMLAELRERSGWILRFATQPRCAAWFWYSRKLCWILIEHHPKAMHVLLTKCLLCLQVQC